MSEARTLDPSATLRAALDAATRRATAAESEAGTLRSRLLSESAGRIQAQEASVDQAIIQAEETAGVLRGSLAQLQTDGKFEEAAGIMQKMADNSARLTALRGSKAELATIRAQPQPQPTPQNTDPLANYSPAVRAWIGANPQFLSDPVFQAGALRAHHSALANNIPTDTREYFEHVERAGDPERFAEPETKPDAKPDPAPQITEPTAENPLSQPAEQDLEVVIDQDRNTRTMPAQPSTRQDNDTQLDVQI